MIVLKYKGIETGRPLGFKVGVSGEWQFTLRDLNLKKLYQSEWKKNTILDVGLDTIGGGAGGENPFNYWHVGNSAAAVTEGQIGLQGWIAASTANQGSDVSAFVGSPNYEYSKTRVHRFNAGAINDTVREVGAGSDPGNNTNFYSRHLVNPVIPVSVDQVLDVAYKHTIWPPLGDVLQSGALTMDGEVFDVLIRGADYDRDIQNDALATMAFSNSGGSSDQRIYAGDIGATNLDTPAGSSSTSYGGAADSNLTYVLTNHYRDQLLEWELNDGNAIGGPIRSIMTRFTGALIQIQFDSQSTPGQGIPKDDTKTMDLTLRQSWVRHV